MSQPAASTMQATIGAHLVSLARMIIYEAKVNRLEDKYTFLQAELIIYGTNIIISFNQRELFGRDRAGARRCLGGGFPAPPFRLRSGFTVPPWPRFPRPPCDPGWSDFPNLVLTLAIAHKTFPIAAEFKCSVHMHSATPPVYFVGWFHTVRIGLLPALCPRTILEPPSAQSPFA